MWLVGGLDGSSEHRAEGESIGTHSGSRHSRKHIKHTSCVTWEKLEVARAIRKTEFTSGYDVESV